MDAQDPAERQGYLRFFYRNWRPTPLGRTWSRFMAWLSGAGLTPSFLVDLRTMNPETGQQSSTVLASVDHEGHRYVVSMLGEGSDWVRNVRAAGGRAFIRRGQPRPVTLVELPPQDRAPVLKAWSRIATSGRRHLPTSPDAPLSDFASVAAAYPVFRIDPA